MLGRVGEHVFGEKEDHEYDLFVFVRSQNFEDSFLFANSIPAIGGCNSVAFSREIKFASKLIRQLDAPEVEIRIHPKFDGRNSTQNVSQN